jgi:hypothetical protein
MNMEAPEHPVGCFEEPKAESFCRSVLQSVMTPVVFTGSIVLFFLACGRSAFGDMAVFPNPNGGIARLLDALVFDSTPMRLFAVAGCLLALLEAGFLAGLVRIRMKYTGKPLEEPSSGNPESSG